MLLAQKQTYRSVEQNSLGINPCTYGQLIYNKGAKNIQMEKRRVSSTSNAAQGPTCTGMQSILEGILER